jgi:hypothetical protein
LLLLLNDLLQVAERRAELSVYFCVCRCNYKKPPFSSYSKDLIEGLGVKVLNEKLTGAESISALSASAVKDMKFDYIGKPHTVFQHTPDNDHAIYNIV